MSNSLSNYGMAKKLLELSCKAKDLRKSSALKSEPNLSSLFQTFSYLLSAISFSDEEKKGRGCSLLLVIFVGIIGKKFDSFPVKKLRIFGTFTSFVIISVLYSSCYPF